MQNNITTKQLIQQNPRLYYLDHSLFANTILPIAAALLGIIIAIEYSKKHNLNILKTIMLIFFSGIISAISFLVLEVLFAMYLHFFLNLAIGITIFIIVTYIALLI